MIFSDQITSIFTNNHWIITKTGIGEYSLFRFLRLFYNYLRLLTLFDQKFASNKLRFIWWLLDWLFAADNPNNQKSENKMWIPRPSLTKNLTHDISYYLTYLMIIWWLFDDYLMIIWWLFALLWLFVKLEYYISMFTLQKCERKRLTRLRIRQAMLPHNTGEQTCTFSYDSLRFASFIAANRPPRSLQSYRGEHAQPIVHQPCEGERVILDGRKRDTIRNQVLARFLTRARSYARERARKLASAPIMSLYTLRARASMCASVLHAREGRNLPRKELSWWT